jgi:hypothetical protein
MMNLDLFYVISPTGKIIAKAYKRSILENEYPKDCIFTGTEMYLIVNHLKQSIQNSINQIKK